MTKQNHTRGNARGQRRMPLFSDTETLIQKFKNKHGDRYDYSQVEFTGCDSNVDIICREHGVFQQRADGHARGQNCPKCVKRHKPSSEEFVDGCLLKFKGRMDYSNTIYKNSRERITVRCIEHGEFSVLPHNHKSSINGGCPACSKTGKLTLAVFIEKSQKVHGCKYNYGNIKTFKNVRSKVPINCPEHGNFLQIADRHLHGNGCPDCANEVIRRKTSMGLDEFIKRAKEKHGDAYDYSCVDYKNGYTKVKILCHKHGAFWQRPHGHLQTRGCEKCGDESKFNFRRQAYVDHCNKVSKGLASLYVIKCSDNKESFYKVGVTLHSVERRFKNVMPYSYEEVISIKDRADFIWDLESQLHRLLKRYAYRPQVSFGGETECFSKMPKSVLKKIDEFRNSKQHQLLA